MNDQAPDPTADPYAAAVAAAAESQRGFLNMAMYHLQQQQQGGGGSSVQGAASVRDQAVGPPHSGHMRNPRNSEETDALVTDTGSLSLGDDEDDVDVELAMNNPISVPIPDVAVAPGTTTAEEASDSGSGKSSRPPKLKVQQQQQQQQLTPKHQIRTPILEETESNLEAELEKSKHAKRDKYVV